MKRRQTARKTAASPRRRRALPLNSNAWTGRDGIHVTLQETVPFLFRLFGRRVSA